MNNIEKAKAIEEIVFSVISAFYKDEMDDPIGNEVLFEMIKEFSSKLEHLETECENFMEAVKETDEATMEKQRTLDEMQGINRSLTF